ncbi:alpha/beta hydrolase [Ramlibacter sp.]|uniref:esterase/lipase family protein n=1 Tax=Ramlibacter sp. TaxID=1917967 RepID=UPI002CC574A3|nr:alpha/beta hydrolase [Ramlibacter sp.]HWI84443.1 alpha/beta hydrolase [Ramlibacter sp.]
MPIATALRSTFPAPPLSLLAVEPLRALFDGFACHVREPLPVGDGHPVIVYPGLGAGALTTSSLRTFLKDCGFTALDWEGGINTGPVGRLHDWLVPLAQRLLQVHQAHGRQVSLVGWSLGGLYARELAKACPRAVRQVVTLATPSQSLGSGNHASGLFRLLHPDGTHLTPQLQARLAQRPPVPTTSIYSRSDGIVSWRGCVEQRSANSESIEVSASHLGMVSHPHVQRILALRLAQPEGRWRPLGRAERLRATAAGRR